MIKLNVNHTRLTASNLDALVEGNIRSILIKMIFSSEWAHLARIAVFTNGQTKVSVSLSGDVCAIPWEVLRSPGEVTVSLRGLGDNGEYVICTENESLGRVEKSNASAGVSEAEEATPDVIDSLLAGFAQVMESGGPSGADGKSVYEIAVDSGFEGTEAEWLASLKGEPGASGVYIGEDAPAVEDVNVWIKPGGEASIPATQAWVKEQLVSKDDDFFPYWNCMLIRNGYVLANCYTRFPATFIEPNEGEAWRSSDIYVRLPYPMREPSIAGTSSIDRHAIGYVRQVSAQATDTQYDTALLKLHIFSAKNETAGAAITDYLRLIVQGKRVLPPADPAFSADAAGSSDAQAIAQSYINAAADGRKFVYGPNFLYSSADTLNGYSTRVKDEQGNYIFGGRMECDTFVQMILHGLAYEDSPFSDEVSTSYDYDDLDTDTTGRPDWALYLLEGIKNNPAVVRSGSFYDVRYADEIAWLMWTMDDNICLFTDHTKAHAGDIAFFRTEGIDKFDEISHVAFVGEEDGVKYIYECTTETAAKPNAVRKTAWSEYTRSPAYYARINFAAIREANT